MGKMGARSWGPIGFMVLGLRGGSSGLGRSGPMLYQWVGISLSVSRIFVSLSILFLLRTRLGPASQEARLYAGRRKPAREGKATAWSAGVRGGRGRLACAKKSGW